MILPDEIWVNGPQEGHDWTFYRVQEEAVPYIKKSILDQRIKELEEKYSDLIMNVSIKHPDETRHETAKRYILQAENRHNDPEKPDQLLGDNQ